MTQNNVDQLPMARLVLESERLRLRPLTLDDIDLTGVLFTDPEVMKYVAPVTAPENLLAETRQATRRGAGGRLGVWCVADRESAEKLGTAVLLPVPIEQEERDWSLLVDDGYPDAEIEIGYILKRGAWGKGVATEACRRLLRFGFEATDLDEIVAITAQDNAASQHVLRKCGFRNEGLRWAYATTVAGFRIDRRVWASDAR